MYISYLPYVSILIAFTLNVAFFYVCTLWFPLFKRVNLVFTIVEFFSIACLFVLLNAEPSAFKLVCLFIFMMQCFVSYGMLFFLKRASESVRRWCLLSFLIIGICSLILLIYPPYALEFWRNIGLWGYVSTLGAALLLYGKVRVRQGANGKKITPINYSLWCAIPACVITALIYWKAGNLQNGVSKFALHLPFFMLFSVALFQWVQLAPLLWRNFLEKALGAFLLLFVSADMFATYRELANRSCCPAEYRWIKSEISDHATAFQRETFFGLPAGMCSCYFEK